MSDTPICQGCEGAQRWCGDCTSIRIIRCARCTLSKEQEAAQLRPPAEPFHKLGWMDDGLAQVVSCGGQLTDFMISSPGQGAHDTATCPICHKTLKLMWRVYAQEVEP